MQTPVVPIIRFLWLGLTVVFWDIRSFCYDFQSLWDSRIGRFSAFLFCITLTIHRNHSFCFKSLLISVIQQANKNIFVFRKVQKYPFFDVFSVPDCKGPLSILQCYFWHYSLITSQYRLSIATLPSNNRLCLKNPYESTPKEYLNFFFLLYALTNYSYIKGISYFCG